MHDDRVIDRLAGADLQRLRLLGAGRLFGQARHAAVMAMVARRDLVGDVVDGKERRARLGLRHEGAHALHAYQQACGRQLAQRAVDGHAAEPKFIDQLAFRGHPVVRGPRAAADLLRAHLLDLRVQRGGQGIGLDGQSGRGRGHGEILLGAERIRKSFGIKYRQVQRSCEPQ
ncbi:hypothetical protein G6F57_020194 [Rhizopus arrhizus]|nr:hypothetical protein G6F57_020194 [Rhizopus arrhizus]